MCSNSIPGNSIMSYVGGIKTYRYRNEGVTGIMEVIGIIGVVGVIGGMGGIRDIHLGPNIES